MAKKKINDAGQVPASVTTPRRNRALPIHPLFFALFPLMSLYATNVGLVPWTDVVRPVCLSVGSMACLYLVIGLAVRDARKGAVIVSSLLFLFFSYGHFLALLPAVTDIIIMLSNNAPAFNPSACLLPIWAAVLILIVTLTLRSRRSFAPITALLNVVGFVLLAVPLGIIATSGTRYPGFAPVLRTLELAPEDDNDAVDTTMLERPMQRPTTESPDIYYIILDAYGREDVLKQFYGYDNSPFIAALEKRGFYVPKRSRPNYGHTIASISSSLNMTYLDSVAARLGPKSTNLLPLHDMVNKNAVANFLRTRGYKFVSISTGFGLTATPDADVLLGGKSATASKVEPYEGLLLDLTPLMLFARTDETLYDQHRDTIQDGFDLIGSAARMRYRKFVFAHILVPHPPFVFGPNGEKIDQHDRPYSLADGSEWMKRGKRTEYREHYIGQLRYANTQILKQIDAILLKSRVRPIIIVQGDHGPRQFLDFESLKNTDVRETFGNLNAFSLPDGNAPKVFYDTISPVNSFRLLFNHTFATHYPQLPDRSYYATVDAPFKYTDVTQASKPEKLN